MIGSSAAISVSFFVAVASLAWSAAYAWTKWLAHRHDVPPQGRASPHIVSADAQRIARLESALEALAVEMERVAEGQRYTARLLDERLPPSMGPGRQLGDGESGRVITPH